MQRFSNFSPLGSLRPGIIICQLLIIVPHCEGWEACCCSKVSKSLDYNSCGACKLPLMNAPENFLLIGKESLSALNNKTSVTIRQRGHSTIHGSPPKLVGQLASSLVQCESCEARVHRQVGSIFCHITGQKVELVSFRWLLQQGGVYFQCGCHSYLKV